MLTYHYLNVHVCGIHEGFNDIQTNKVRSFVQEVQRGLAAANEPAQTEDETLPSKQSNNQEYF